MVDHPKGDFDSVRFSYDGPLNPGEFNSLLVNTWYTSRFLLNSSEVPWVLNIDSQGMVTGSYTGSCALTGAIEPSMHDGFFHRISLEATGCIESGSFSGAIFALELPELVVAHLYIVNEAGQPDRVAFSLVPPPAP